MPEKEENVKTKRNPKVGLNKLNWHNLKPFLLLSPSFSSILPAMKNKLSAKLQSLELRKHESLLFGSSAKCHSMKLLHFFSKAEGVVVWLLKGYRRVFFLISELERDN